MELDNSNLAQELQDLTNQTVSYRSPIDGAPLDLTVKRSICDEGSETVPQSKTPRTGSPQP